MSKFKIGDKVRCVRSYRDHVIEGCVYTVLDVTGDMYLHVDTGDHIIGVGGYAADRFELVTSEPEYLTPEQVFKALQDKQELQYMYEYTTGIGDYVVGWRDCRNPQFANILNRNWRVKPVPKTIDYYGTELPKPITKVEAKELGLNVVYKLMLGLGSNNPVKIITNLDRDIGDNLYFKSESDALVVREAILNPFK